VTAIAIRLLRIERATSGRELACVRIRGDIDMSVHGQLMSLASELGEYKLVCLDLSGAAFAGTTLLRFLLTVRQAMPDSACLMVCRPAPLVMMMLTLTGVELAVSVQANLPPVWIAPRVE
jgi:anti-anti-sigma regulatory factor